MKLPSQRIINLSVVTLCLIFTLALQGCSKGCKTSSEGGGAGASAGALDLIPSGKNILLGIQWQKLQSSPLGSKLKDSVPPEMAPLLEGIDGITLGFTVSGPGQEPQDILGVVSGNLDPAKLLAQLTEQAKEDGIQISNEEYQGVKIYSGSKDPSMGIAFIGKNGLIGKKEAVQKAIDLSKGQGTSVQKDQNLMDLLKAISTDKMIWAVALVPEGAIPAGGQGGPGNPMSALSTIKAIDLALDMDQNLNLDLGVIAGSPEDAKQMETMANSYKTLFGASLAQKEPSLGKILNNLKIGVDGSRVALNLSVDKATVEELSKKASPGAGSAAPAPEAPPPADSEEAPSEEPSGDEEAPTEQES